MHQLFPFYPILSLFYVFLFLDAMFSDGVEGEFRERDVRLTFREAVQLFEHRSQFIRRSSNACLVRTFFTCRSFSFFLTTTPWTLCKND